MKKGKKNIFNEFKYFHLNSKIVCKNIKERKKVSYQLKNFIFINEEIDRYEINNITGKKQICIKYIDQLKILNLFKNLIYNTRETSTG